MDHLSARRMAGLLLLGIAAALLAWVVSASALPGVTRIVTLAGAAMALNLLIGNAGMVSMGHGLFLGLGAYVVAVSNVKHGVAVGWGALGAMAAALVIATIAGAIALRARALFFALLTLALGQVAFVFVARNYTLTGGDDGLVGISLPGWLDNDVAPHLLAVGVTTLLCLVLMVLLASPFGATLRAVRDNRNRVASLGGNPIMYEFAAFVIAGFLGAVSGIVAAVTDRAVEPTLISWTTGATLLVMVALGGRFTFYGPIIGVVILELARTWVQAHSTHADLVVGTLVVICAIAFPEGIVQQVRDLLARLRGRDGEPTSTGDPRAA
jgi:branched-chain amino acid transport system permease protein